MKPLSKKQRKNLQIQLKLDKILESLGFSVEECNQCSNDIGQYCYYCEGSGIKIEKKLD